MQQDREEKKRYSAVEESKKKASKHKVKQGDSNYRNKDKNNDNRQNDDGSKVERTPKDKHKNEQQASRNSEMKKGIRDGSPHGNKRKDRGTDTSLTDYKDHEKTTHRPAKRPKTGRRARSPHRLLSDVVLVLSGYANPRRAGLRTRALALGAACRRDWGPGCTHLVCAFANTPKLKHVRSLGTDAIIVTGEWIEECCGRQRRLPWQWFATEPAKRLPRSDSPEMSESEPEPEREKVNSSATECDTDDEIEKVLQNQRAGKQEPQSAEKADEHRQRPETLDNLQAANVSNDSDIVFVADERIKANISISDSESDSWTDEEKVNKVVDCKIKNEASLPEFFEGFTFAIDPNLKDSGFDVNLLKRYISAYGGEVVEALSKDSDINYVVSLNGECALRKLVLSGTIVKPHWVWRCHDARKKVSMKEFVVE